MKYNIYDMALSYAQSLKPIEKKLLLERYGSSKTILEIAKPTLRNILGRRWAGKQYDPKKFIGQAKYILDFLKKKKIQTVRYDEADYPYGLTEIPDLPFLLYYRGDINFDYNKSIAIVGTRKPTEDGVFFAKQYTDFLIKNNYTIVSGLALGVDSISHSMCVQNKSKTIAVLGCGIDKIYPSQNKDIARDIIKNEGAIVSEYPPGIPPNRWNFPKRNRIIVGLSKGVLIIQSPKRSGSLISAYLSTDYNRDLFVIAPANNEQYFQGNHELILQGAREINTPENIISEWE